MGGHVGGEIAARTAIDTLQAEFARKPSADGLAAAIHEANRAVWERGHVDADLRGMGTTMIAAALVATDEGDRLGARQRGGLAGLPPPRRRRSSSSPPTTRWPRSSWPGASCPRRRRPCTRTATSSPGRSASSPTSPSTSGRSSPRRATASCCAPTGSPTRCPPNEIAERPAPDPRPRRGGRDPGAAWPTRPEATTTSPWSSSTSWSARPPSAGAGRNGRRGRRTGGGCGLRRADPTAARSTATAAGATMVVSAPDGAAPTSAEPGPGGAVTANGAGAAVVSRSAPDTDLARPPSRQDRPHRAPRPPADHVPGAVVPRRPGRSGLRRVRHHPLVRGQLVLRRPQSRPGRDLPGPTRGVRGHRPQDRDADPDDRRPRSPRTRSPTCAPACRSPRYKAAEELRHAASSSRCAACTSHPPYCVDVATPAPPGATTTTTVPTSTPATFGARVPAAWPTPAREAA